MKEFEFKYFVSKDIFYELINKIKNKYPDSTSKNKLQINYYYDTENYDLHKQGVTCRIRLSEDKIIGQYKEHYLNGSHCSKETDFQVNELPRTIMRGEQRLIFQGELVTTRMSFSITPYVKIECDVNFYLGNCDYEIEIEYEDGYYDFAKQIADSLMLTEINNFSKYDRFLKAKNVSYEYTINIF